MARLLVLQADLLLEWPGIGTSETIDVLDKGGETYRRLHFFRSSTGSLVATRDLLDGLMANSTFREWLAQNPEQEVRFKAHKHAFDQRRSLFERIRNQMGEHVVEHVGATVLRFKPGDTAPAEIDKDTGIPTAKLAESILYCALMPGVPPDQWETELRLILTEVRAATIEGLRAMVIALYLYAKHYPIFPQTR